MRGLVSVIVPVFNVEKYLTKCIESIISQSYTNIELILVDDGSTDGSSKICAEFVHKDDRIIYCRQSNSGPSLARNHGISISRGEYLYFVDSDDYLNPDSLDILVRCIKGVDLVIASYCNHFTENGESMCRVVHFQENGVLTQGEFISILGELIDAEMFHYIWHKLYRSRFIKGKIDFLDSIKIGEDMVFNLDYLQSVRNIRITSEPVYNHILYNHGSITKRFKADLFPTRKFVHQKTRAFLVRYDQYAGDNKEAIDRLYERRIMSCFSNLFMQDSPLSRQEKVAVIRAIVDDDSTREPVGGFAGGSYFTIAVRFIMKHRMCRTIYLTFWLRGLLVRLKHWKLYWVFRTRIQSLSWNSKRRCSLP